MDYKILLTLSCVLALTSAWSVPFYPVRGPPRYTRHTHPPTHFYPPTHRVPGHDTISAPVREIQEEDEHRQRPKRDHDFDSHDRRPSGVTGPIHTFVKTDKNANYKWGVRHHVGNKYIP